MKLDGNEAEYKDIADEISKVDGVIMQGLFLSTANAAVFPDSNDSGVVEKVKAPILHFTLSYFLRILSSS